MEIKDRDLQKLYAFIKQMIIDEIQSSRIDGSTRKQSTIIGADVTGVSGDNITVTLAGTNSDITIPNLTGQAISISDRVEVVIKNGNYTNAFVGWKHP